MEFKVKSGYVLVSSVDASSYELDPSFRAGKIVVGPDVDLGVIVFFKDCEVFNDDLLLVKTDDIVVWVKPEVVAPIVEVSSNESQSN